MMSGHDHHARRRTRRPRPRRQPGRGPREAGEGGLTFGLKRVEILSAQFNGATLLVLGLLITYE